MLEERQGKLQLAQKQEQFDKYALELNTKILDKREKFELERIFLEQ